MNILWIGCGNMGGAMLQAWLPLLESTGQEVWILRLSKAQLSKLEARKDYPRLRQRIHLLPDFAGLQAVSGTLREAGKKFDFIVLGMKPQVIREQIHKFVSFDENSLWLTIAAGLSLSWYRQYKADLRMLRMMPNLGVQVGQSASLLYQESDLVLSRHEQNLWQQLSRNLGTLIRCRSEEQLDNATPITGSGPAYFYLLTEILQAELQKQGFNVLEAAQLARATFLGSAAYLKDCIHADGVSVASLRQAVTSKGGVTEAALAVLSPQLRNSLEQAIISGIVRNRELQNG
ncbi:MAG: pyrroline-5-carboxylate reductase dimerization domain-containing protein [Spirochaetota bacterium]